MYLVLTDSSDEFARIKLTLGASSKRVTTAAELRTAVERYTDCRIVVVGPSIKDARVWAIAEELRISRPEISVIVVRHKLDLPTLSAALTAGIKDVVDSQDASALVNAVRRCEEVEGKIAARHSEGKNHSPRGKIVLVYSAKGGAGKTTISSNLAASIASKNDLRVCLVDLDFQFGDIAVVLRLEPEKSLFDALSMGENIDTNSLSALTIRFEDLFDTLLAPTTPIKQDLVKSENIERVLSLLQSMYDIVIIDSSTAFNEVMAKAFEVADIALLITTLDIPAIKNLKLVMGTLDSLNFPPSRRRVILNRADQKIGISVGDVEDLVSAEVSIKVPNSAEVSQSINDGIPLVIAQPRNPVSKAFEEMGELIIAMEKSLEHESVA